MRARRTVRFSLVAATAAIVLPPAAFAHARAVRTDPAAAAVLAAPPRAVRVVFDDVVKGQGLNEVVPNTGGPSVVAGKPRLEKGGTVLVLPLRPRLPRGDYTVVWQILSDDGHRVSGVFAFGVGKGRAPPTPVLKPPSTTPSSEQVAARWLLFLGLLLAAGAAGFWLVAVRPALQTVPQAAPDALEPVERPRFAATALAGFVLFVAGAADLVRGEGWDTRFGLALHVALVVAAVGAVLSVLAAVSNRFRWPVAALGIAIAAAPSFAGHSLDAGVPWPNVLVDLAHIGAAAVWTGCLVGIVLLAPAARRLAGGAELTVELVRRVSAAALTAVVLLVVTGIVRSIFELRSVSQLWTTGYGRAVLVKVGLLVVLVGIGWWNRRDLGASERIRRNVTIELVLIAGVLVAVGFLTQLRPGRDAPQASAQASSLQDLARPPAPPAGALVLAKQDGLLAVALATQPDRYTVTVLAQSGGGARGLDVSVDGKSAEGCGPGCYTAPATSPAARVLRVDVGGRTTLFTVPRNVLPADRLLRSATRAFEHARSVRYRERLSSGSTRAVTTVWQEETPNRVSYTIAGGAQAVVIGPRRWDRNSGGAWTRSDVSSLVEPSPIWGTDVTNAFELRRDADTVTVAWANPTIPAFFTAVLDRRTLLPRTLDMTAAAHFMHHDYLEFNRPLGIRPPTR